MNTTYYFTHDYNALTDEKILEMRADYGIAGYGMFWGIVEQLAQATDNKLSLSAIGGLSLLLGVAKADLSQFLADAIDKYGLFASDGTMYWSESLIRRIELRQNASKTYSQAGKKGAAKRWAKEVFNGVATQNGSQVIQNDSQAMQNDNQAIPQHLPNDSPPIAFDSKESKVKERKVKERKGESEEHTRTPARASPEVELAELQATCSMSAVPPDFTERLWNHYEATKRMDGSWIDSNGHTISNPAKKIVGLWQTERAKSNGNSISNAANGIRPQPGKYGDL